MKSALRRVTFRPLLVILCTVVLMPGIPWHIRPSFRRPNRPRQKSKLRRLRPTQLDSLVAPIALFPDPLLAQTLAASTYPPHVGGSAPRSGFG